MLRVITRWLKQGYHIKWRWHTAALASAWAAVLVAALMLRLWILFVPYWYDESMSAYVVGGDFWRMLRLVFASVQVPVYFIVLFGWIRLVGASPAATGLLSLLFGLAATYVVAWVGRNWYGKPSIGWLAAGIFWVSYGSIIHSTDTKMYSLLMLIAALAVFCLHQWRAGQRFARWGWVLVNLAGFATHLLYFFFIVAQGMVLWLWVRQGRPVVPRRQVMATIGTLAAAMLPLCLKAAIDYFRWYWTPGSYLYPVTQDTFLARLWYWGTVLPTFFFPSHHLPAALSSLITWTLVAALLVAVARVIVRRRELVVAFTGSPQGELMVLCLVPYLLMALLKNYTPRYILYTLPLWCLWLAAGLNRIRPVWVRQWGAVTLAGLLVFGNLQFVVREYLWQADFRWREILQTIEAQEGSGEGQLVLVNTYDRVPHIRGYYRGRLPLAGFFPPSLVTDGDTEAAMLRWEGLPIINEKNIGEILPLVYPHHTIWLVDIGSQRVADPRDLVERYMARACHLDSEIALAPEFIPLRMYMVRRYTGCVWPT